MIEMDFGLKPMLLMLLVETRETPQHFLTFVFAVFLWLAGAYQIFERMTSFF